METRLLTIKENKKTNKINTPFGYFGSKNKIAIQLCDDLPPHNCWVDVFCGSASLTLRKVPAPIEIINDIDKEVVNFFFQLRNNLDHLCNLIELTPYAEQELINARVKESNLAEIERARRFLVQAMMAVNGIFGEEKGGFSYSDSYTRNNTEARVNRWNNAPERIKAVAERLKHVRIENKNAITIIKRFLDRPATLLYLDPPYLGDRTNGYNKDANNEKFHREMLNLANKAKCMIFISGYNHDLYDRILTPERGWKKRKILTSTKDTDGIAHGRKEIVWINKHYQKALKNHKIAIRLTAKEKAQGKVNPERKKKQENKKTTKKSKVIRKKK